jgi:3-phenylpropionate/trans-cinnamate dioxygenase ferredoxin reductase subunit
VRVEHWANARHQPVAAAKAMLGQDLAYDRVPYFLHDQYDLGMEYNGYVEARRLRSRSSFRGDVPGREFVAFWLAGDGRVLIGMNVNIWDVNDAISALVRAGKPVSKGGTGRRRGAAGVTGGKLLEAADGERPGKRSACAPAGLAACRAT